MKSELARTRPGGFDIRPASQTEAIPINDFIYLSKGLSNSYLVVTSEGRVVINTGMGFEAGVHKRCFDAVDSSPVRYIVLTQGHVDHVGGADLFFEPGCEIVAQKNNAACQADDARIRHFRVRRSALFFAEAVGRANRFAREHKPGAPVPAQSTPTPTITFDDHFDFELGGVRFELLRLSPRC